MNINMKHNGPCDNILGDVVIDGRSFSGSNIVIKDGKVIVDGVTQSGKLEGGISVTVNGDVESLSTASGDVTANNVGKVSTASGDVKCGDVLGSIKTASGDISCEDVGGSVSTVSGDIEYRR